MYVVYNFGKTYIRGKYSRRFTSTLSNCIDGTTARGNCYCKPMKRSLFYIIE